MLICFTDLDGTLLNHDDYRYDAAIPVIQKLQQAGVPIGIATVRMQKPGEMGLMRVLLRHPPDFVLARNLAAIDFFTQNKIRVLADFTNLSRIVVSQMCASAVTNKR